jgi:N-acetylmuramoyl-L-alanine amidase
MITLLKLTPYTGGTVAPSPNHGARRALAIEGIVLHATADEGNETGTLTWMRSPRSRVSCHMLVSRSGDVTRLVGDHQRAWHAGRSRWRGTVDVNSITLGIEIANRNDGEPYTDVQYDRVAEIVAHYCRQGLTLEDDVVGHEAIAQDRRTDPVGWDWERFRRIVKELLDRSDDDPVWSPYDRRSGERLPTPSILPPHGPSLRTINAAKPVLCSRTIWLNGVTVLAAGAVIVGEALDLAYSVGLTIPQEITMWALFGIGMVNFLLRFETKCPVSSNKNAYQR